MPFNTRDPFAIAADSKLTPFTSIRTTTTSTMTVKYFFLFSYRPRGILGFLMRVEEKRVSGKNRREKISFLLQKMDILRYAEHVRMCGSRVDQYSMIF